VTLDVPGFGAARPGGRGFDPGLWHGMQDPLVLVDQAMHLAATLPNVQVALHPDEGHFFYRRRLREILGRLAGAVTPVRSRAR
jgi:hypothetical protein